MSVDTLTLAQRLRAAELPAGQAEAIAAAIGAAVLEGAATKDDLNAVKIELKSDIAGLRQELKSDLSAARQELKSDLSAARQELKSDLDQACSGLELKIEQLRTEIERSRNQLLVGFVGTQIALGGFIVAAVKLL